MDRFLEIDEVIANASTIIKGMDSELELLARQWVWLALRKIGPSFNDIEVADIDVIDKTVTKPLDCISLIDLALYTSDGGEIGYRYNKGGSSRTHGKDNTGTLLNIYEDPHFIHISDDLTSYGLTPTVCRLRYYKFPLDSCGMPLVPEIHLFAVMLFIKWMYELRENPNNSFSLSVARNDFMSALDVAKTQNKSVTPIQAKEIARTWKSMLPNPNFNRY